MARHILIVEDSDLVVGALTAFFEAVGWRATAVPTVAAAIRVVDTDPPDVAVLDLSLPDGDGLMVARHLRVAAPHARFVAMTGHDDDAITAACLEAGCAQVLIKPVSLHLLRRVVDEL